MRISGLAVTGFSLVAQLVSGTKYTAWREISAEGRILQELEQELEPVECDVAIVGGGLSGLYAGWRLLTADEILQLNATVPSVCIYEATNRVGGRLLSVSPPENVATEDFKAEFGDMHFQMMREQLTSFVVETLGIEVKDSPVYDDMNIVHLRGKHMRENTVAETAKEIYQLNWLESDKHPTEILNHAVELVVPNAHNLTDEEWAEVKVSGMFEGENLHNLGLWNVLSKVLSLEAYELVNAYVGLDSILSNQNAAEGLHYISQYHTVPVEYVTPVDGMETIANRLREEVLNNGGQIFYNHVLTNFDIVNATNATNATDVPPAPEDGNSTAANDTALLLTFMDGQVVEAKNLILALSPDALSMLQMSGEPMEFDEEVHEAVKSVEAVPYTKTFMCYEDAWWKRAGVHKGRSVTDKALRQTYYYDKCLMTSFSDGRSATFWSVYDSKPQKLLNVTEFDSEESRWQHMEAPAALVEHTTNLLKTLHNLPYIPQPIAAAYIAWSHEPYEGGGHVWRAGSDPVKVQEMLRKPMEDVPVYIIGEAYSLNQRSIEGDFETAEAVLQEYFLPIIDEIGVFEPVSLPIRGSADGARIGKKLSGSADGKRVAVVSSLSVPAAVDSRSLQEALGHVLVYEYLGSDDVGVWDLIGNTFEDEELLGGSEYSAVLSGTGNRLAVGVMKGDENTTKMGYVQVFDFIEAGNWTKVGPILTANLTDDGFGTSLAFDGEGKRLAVGAPLAENSTGRVHVFDYMEGNWMEAEPILGTFNQSEFGLSVALSNNGSILVAGGPFADTQNGYVKAFSNIDDVWEPHGSEILGDAEGMLGHSVALSSTGEYLAVGSPFDGGGKASVYHFRGENWTMVGSSVGSTVDGDRAGLSVDLSDNGRLLAVGIPGIEAPGSEGYVAIYLMNNTTWEQLGRNITGEPGDNTGYVVSLSGEGVDLLVGSPSSDEAGRGYVSAYRMNIVPEMMLGSNETMNETIPEEPENTEEPDDFTEEPDEPDEPTGTTEPPTDTNSTNTTSTQVPGSTEVPSSTVDPGNATTVAPPGSTTAPGPTEAMDVIMEYEGTGWLGFGVASSDLGLMVGSKAVIGVFDGEVSTESGQETSTNVGIYDMNSQSVDGVVFDPELTAEVIRNGRITEFLDSSRTRLSFTILDPSAVGIKFANDTFLYAYGSTRDQLSYHDSRGDFSINNLGDCTEECEPSSAYPGFTEIILPDESVTLSYRLRETV